MSKQSGIYTAAILTLAVLTGLSSFVILAQKSSKEGAPPPEGGAPVMWRDPGDVSSRNLLVGPATEEMKPDLSKITYIKDEQTGYSVKYHVKDGAGRTWVVKVGNEVRPETAAVRLLWALGYATEINYLVPCVQIPGAAKPRKDVPRCEGGGFADARFEARPADVKRLDVWSWKENPFVGAKEFKGLVVLMALLNNWDLKDENNRVLQVKGANGQDELQYVISDLGATFGKTGGGLTHSRNEPENYARSEFIKGVEGGRVRFAYGGKSQYLFDNITVEDARWIAGLLSRLTDEQIQDAFRAGNFKPDEIQTLAAALRARINELVRVTGATPPQPTATPSGTPIESVTPLPTPNPTPMPVATPMQETAPALTPTPTDTLPPPQPEASPTPGARPAPAPSPTPAATPTTPV
jgi:hypothetical protein